MKRIAITGSMTSGKTTLARDIADIFGGKVISFATALKQLAADGLNDGVPLEKSETYTFHPYGASEPLVMSGRETLQQFGDAVKTIDTYFWARLALAEARKNQSERYILDDLRYRFEEEILRQQGWTIIKVNTVESTRFKRYQELYGRLPTAAEMSHSSEVEIDLIKADFAVNGEHDRVANARAVMAYAFPRTY